MNGLPHAFEAPAVSAMIRMLPEDFQVVEDLGFTPEGSGEHVFLRVRKRLANTAWVARQLAIFAGVSPRQVSYAGLKDRHALAEQWFSVHLPGKSDPDWSRCRDEGGDSFRILEQCRHGRKLRRGALKGNRFCIVVRGLQGPKEDLAARLDNLTANGVPNYFGEQRFGHEGANITHAEAMFAGKPVQDRQQRGLYLSAARAYLFNQVLARRVSAGSWNQGLAGDVMVHEGSRSQFLAPVIDASISQRVTALALHPSGPLWGKGELVSRFTVRDLEQSVVVDYPHLCRGLEAAGLVQERRPLRLRVEALQWQWEADDVLVLGFKLLAGAYATSVLRELVSLR